MAPDPLQENLARLARRHPQLAERVRGAGQGGVEPVAGPRGAMTLAEAGVRLGSAYDPAAEARRLVEKAGAAAADVCTVIGLGTGHAVEELLASSAAPLLVHEPSPARLRALLALRGDLRWLDHERVHWAADPAELAALFVRHYQPGTQPGSFVHPAVARVDPEGARAAVDAVARAKIERDLQARTIGRMAHAWARLAAMNAPHLLRAPSIGRLAGRLRGVPAVVVAAGPSLDRQIPWLQRHADDVLVVAIGQALGALRRAGIEPHLVHVIESQDVTHQLTAAGPTDQLVVVLLASSHPALFRVPVRARFAAYPPSHPFASWLAEAAGEPAGHAGGATVAHSAVLLAAALGADPVVLVGQDLAFSGNRVYATGSAYEMVGIETDGQGSFSYTRVEEKLALLGRSPEPHGAGGRQDLLWVPGWHGEPVPTDRAYASFLQGYPRVAERARELGARLVNCTEGGARIPGVEHAPLADALAPHLRPGSGRRARALLLEAFDGHRPVSPARLAGPVERSRRVLHQVQRAARSGAGLLQGVDGARARERLASARLARAERTLRRALRRVPWIDAVIQPELLHLQAELHRRVADAPEEERVLAHQRALFQAAQAGAERGRALLEALVQALERSADEKTGVRAGPPAAPCSLGEPAA